jgi:hypothetical protein
MVGQFALSFFHNQLGSEIIFSVPHRLSNNQILEKLEGLGYYYNLLVQSIPQLSKFSVL